MVPLGLAPPVSLQELVDKVILGKAAELQSVLTRPGLRVSISIFLTDTGVEKKLCGLVSLKIEDQQQSAAPTRFQRLRASVPARLWRWRRRAGWRWKGGKEHINVLELRGVVTTIRYRIEELQQFDQRCEHLVDSLEVFRSLTGVDLPQESSLMRLRSFLLVCSSPFGHM